MARSQCRAQANSMLRIPNPNGITITAGPGSTSIATPISITVVPIMAITIVGAVAQHDVDERCPYHISISR
jgi:hypothetical protein